MLSISNPDYLDQITPSDQVQVQMAETALQDLLFQYSAGAYTKLIPIHVRSLDLLPEAIEKLNLAANNQTIAGIVLMGHGNKETYAISNKSYYSGPQVASVLAGVLEKYPSARNTFVYFSACLMGSGRDNFLTRFVTAFVNKMRPSDQNDKIYRFIAHQFSIHPTLALTEDAGFSLTKTIVYNLRFPHVMNFINGKIFFHFGRKAAHKTALISSVATFAIAYAVAYAAINVFNDPAVAQLSMWVAIPAILTMLKDSYQSVYVRTVTVSKDQIPVVHTSTARSVLKQCLRLLQP